MQLLHPTGLVKISIGSNWVQKTKTLFLNIDFNFAYFANFNFAHFEIEKIFGLIWVKLQNG